MNRDSAGRKKVQPLRQRLRALASETILEAAEEVFARDGLHGARMEAIAQRAGVAVGTLYNHFEDRAALWEAVVTARRSKLVTALDAALARGEGQPFAAQLDAFLATVFDHFRVHGRLFALLVQGESVHAPGRKQLMRDLGLRAALLVERGVAQGALAAQDADAYPWLLVGMARGLLLRSLMGEAPAGAEAPERVVARVFLKGAGRA